MRSVTVDVNAAVQTLEKRLRRAQLQRIFLLWGMMILFGLVGVLFWQFHHDAVKGCRRGSQSAVIQSELAKRLGAIEASRRAAARARLDCGAAYSIF